MGDMDRDNMLEALDLGGMKESIKKNLEQEGKDFFINMIRQKMSGAGGGGAVSPEVLKGLDSSPAGGGDSTQQ
jgi:hypothetical protein